MSEPNIEEGNFRITPLSDTQPPDNRSSNGTQSHLASDEVKTKKPREEDSRGFQFEMTIREVSAGQSGLPVANSTKSYWHKEPSQKLYGYRSSEDLPETTDIAIIGSGITGSFAAHFLKSHGGPDCSVVMLEAREACWGATGRNGGHCQPIVYASDPPVAIFELETYRFLKDFVRDNHIPCDWVDFEGVHAFLTEEIFDAACTAIEKLELTHPELAAQVDIIRTTGSAEGKQKPTLSALKVPGAVGAITQKNAASLWPYKLVAWVLEQLLDDFPASAFNLQTSTPVTDLQRLHDETASSPRWLLTTPRGRMTAKTVVLCTNAYTSRLLPKFSDLIVPTRGQVAALLPPAVSGEKVVRLDHSYVFIENVSVPGLDRPAARDDYLVQRPLPNGELIFGGGRFVASRFAVGEWRDDAVEESVSVWLKEHLSPPLDLSPPDALQGSCRRETLSSLLDSSFEWTGIMGFSRDDHPWVGPVPASLGGGDGLYISAGYTGHGMPVAALAARAVAHQIIGEMDVNFSLPPGFVDLPDMYRLTEERVQISRTMLESVSDAQKRGWATYFPQLMGI